MATGKNVFLIFADLTDDVLKTGEAEQLVKMRRKGALVPLTVAKDVKAEALAGAATGESIADAARNAGYVVEPIAPGSELSVVDGIRNEAGLLAVLDQALAIPSTRMLIVVVTRTLALFYGLGCHAWASHVFGKCRCCAWIGKTETDGRQRPHTVFLCPLQTD